MPRPHPLATHWGIGLNWRELAGTGPMLGWLVVIDRDWRRLVLGGSRGGHWSHAGQTFT